MTKGETHRWICTEGVVGMTEGETHRWICTEGVVGMAVVQRSPDDEAEGLRVHWGASRMGRPLGASEGVEVVDEHPAFLGGEELFKLGHDDVGSRVEGGDFGADVAVGDGGVEESVGVAEDVDEG